MKKNYTLFFALMITGLGYSQIISQYVETNSGSTPKGIEIWNNTGATLDFSVNNLVIEKGSNGGTPSTDFTLSTGTLTAGDVIVIGTSDMEAITLANGSSFFLKPFIFNGDDALVVKYGGSTTDVFGNPGNDPGSSWTGSGVNTRNQNIEINSGITTGTLTGFTDPSTRFTTVNTNPSGANGDEGFGIAPASVSSDTEIQFTTTSASVAEDSGTYDLVIEITNEDATATLFDVVLISGDIADIDGYTTQSETFPGSSTTDVTVTITITDDAIIEADEVFTFEIQNVAGGNNAMVGTNNSFDLTIQDDDTPPPTEGWQITAEETSFIIDFDTTVSGVNEGSFNGSGFTTSPTNGQLDSDTWEVTGFSSSLSYGGSETSGDYARGSSTGGVSTGGIYSFDTGGSNNSLGAQPGGSDFTPGTFTIRAQNQTGNTVVTAYLAYLVYVYNDQGRASSLNFSYSTDDISYTDVAALDLTTSQAADGSPAWVSNSKSTSITGLTIADGDYLYLRWSGDDAGGSGSRDEIAIDDIDITFSLIPPTTYTYNGSWLPSDPSGVSLSIDNITVINGTTNITANTEAATLTIDSGATLLINDDASITSASLTNNGTLTLTSVSDGYSSLITDAISGSGTVNYERHVNGNTILGDANAIGNNDLISPPLSGQTFLAFSNANSNLLANPGNANEKAFAPFDKTTGNYENYIIGTDDAETLDAGVGYRAASDDTATLTFTGTVNTGVVTNNIENSGPAFADWNLIGNPYPSYLKVQDFLNYEVTSGIKNLDLFVPTTAAIYGFDGDGTGTGGSGYTIYNLANTIASTVITPGQGFLVSADASDVTAYDVTFDTTMRATGTDDDFIVGRGTSALIFLELQIATASDSFTTDFYFNENASLGLDPGYDAAIFGAAPAFSLYSHLVEDNMGTPFAIQTLGDMDLEETTVALGVNANQGEQITFSISQTTLPATVNVFLEDIVANTSTQITNGDYILTPTTNLNGTGRFFINFKDAALSTTDNTFDQLNIYANQTNRTINISGQLEDETIANVYDMQGRLVTSQQLIIDSRLQTIDASTLSSGIYVVKLTNGNQKKTEKIILK